ncbi:aldo/keto reductase [Acidisoma cladoniae]|uniref:aldo/keto reductase n=1 Tax=Acidisoma cladoniae TaxID=3040935 RepID=UPI00254F9E32|nr:aldo/keto reductase [Acidisoma sp. PAMC 29798]
MEYRQLGRSGLKVSALTLGTMTFGGKGRFAFVGKTNAADASRMVDIALDAGVNLLDTSDVYSTGASEEILGQAVKGKRDNVLIASKARFPMGAGPNDAGLSRYHLIRACEASLRRLDVDHIDLYQVHEWDGLTPVEETMQALESLVASGKVRYIGVSNFCGWQLMKALGAADRAGTARFVSQQIHYTLEAREAEYELVPISLDQGLGILVWSPLAGGLLSGKYRRGETAAEGGRDFAGWQEPPIRDESRLYDIIELLVQIGEEHGTSAAEIALAWLLRRPAVSSVVIGATTEAQLRTNLKSVELNLTDDDMERLNAASKLPLLYPYWHQALTASDRLGAVDLSLLAQYLPV